MVIKRGAIWWADLDLPVGSGPGYRRPVLVMQSDSFNKSKINTVIVVVITSNLRLAEAPGNILFSSLLKIMVGGFSRLPLFVYICNVALKDYPQFSSRWGSSVRPFLGHLNFLLCLLTDFQGKGLFFFSKKLGELLLRE